LALPHLLKYIYTHGTDEVIRRGKKIHIYGYVELVEYDPLLGTAVFRVKDDNYATFYKVHIQKVNDPQHVSLRCTCPYNLGDICRHEAASLLQLQEMLDKNLLKSAETVYDQRHTVLKMKFIDLKTIRQLCSKDTLTAAENYLRNGKAEIESARDEMVKATVELGGEKIPVIIRKNEERNFDTSCNYVEEQFPLCLPKVIVFLQLLNAYGPHYFDSIRNWDKEKNKLLEAYGYSLKDDLGGKFEFAYKEGKPFLRVLDAGIKRVNAPAPPPPRTAYAEEETLVEKAAPPVNILTHRLGVVINFNKKNYPYFTIDAVWGEVNDENNAFSGKTEKLDLTKYVDAVNFSEPDKQLLASLRKLQESEINKYISRNSPFSGIWENIIHQDEDDLPEDTRHLIREYLFPKLKKTLFTLPEGGLLFQLHKGKPFKTANLQKLIVSAEELKPSFDISRHNGSFEIKATVKAGGLWLDLSDNEAATSFFYLYNHQLFPWEDQASVETIETFLPAGSRKEDFSEWTTILQNQVLPLAREYKINFDRNLLQEVKDGKPEVSLFLVEKGDYLVFQPSFIYKGYETKAKDRDEIVIPAGDKVTIVHRNRDAEQEFIDKLQNLHSNFIYQPETHSLALKGTDVLKNNWFFLFVDAMSDRKIPVFGFDALKNFRFNTARPSTRIFINNNTDWFDARVDIAFGDQHVTVAEVKRALANKQQFVQLGDGTLGILPEEWIKKYSLLFRVGEGKTNQLKLSRYHMSVIDELYENRDEAELVMQLEAKYENLREFNNIREIDPPEGLRDVLRPYQLSGYQWLNYLHEVKWGGILADDMGLGKTVQALTFMQQYKNEHGRLQSMVVCPTTLIYNWENEIKKFTPKLIYLIHHGPLRAREKDKIQGYDVIITTYGTLRSDIKLMVGLELDYLVLDESQSIKNPASKVTRAATLLNAKHRLCMSGTPLQNNTFDIFAQMNFLNPGMLGSMEFFRQEFAIPIDKFGEPERKEHLRKLLYPFILRRTKEQVAKDLPDKTETILFCEMEDEQRSIYDAYRNDYRNQILGSIESQGIQKSQLTILQGLMKLRQICDSPAILNEQEKFENHSIKLDELTREITENISNHKALVFSQFLGMLGLIRERLDSLGVPYEYFDGSTSAPDREKAIQSFQNDEKKRVFLISLKAGGVGLNLTAADYVYIVDPWWNPAVEQQAIDRTHRIGQEKNIFAYRMICKDTIEDKIIQLQEKKRALAKDLIADDNSFVKSLTREDVEYLFS
jgi:superfamily II DNA or RNA helicase